jgi:hypothetical protein
MKIPVVTLKQVEVVTLVEKEVTEMVTIPNTITHDHPQFKNYLTYLSSLEFVATSCIHTEFCSFYSYEQGDGSNTSDIDSITILYQEAQKLTIKVKWKGRSLEKDTAIVIFKLGD